MVLGENLKVGRMSSAGRSVELGGSIAIFEPGRTRKL
jgi:hypothetical protein